MTKIKKSDLLLVISLIALVVLTRTILHLGENIEFVTASAITAGYFLQQKKYAIWATLFGLILSDTLIGNTMIFLFTWSGFLAAPVLGIILSKINFGKRKMSSIIVSAEAMGIVSTMFFFLWTNLGVVLTTNMYAKTAEGLVQSYINALPFLRNQLLGNMFFVPLIFITVITIQNVYANRNFKIASK